MPPWEVSTMSLKKQIAVLVCVAIGVGILGLGLARVNAGQPNENLLVSIELDTPEIPVFYTPGAQVPQSIPLGVDIGAQVGAFSGVDNEDISFFEATLGGTLEVSGDEVEVIDPIQSEEPLLHWATPSTSHYLAVMDGALLDFEDASSRGDLMFVAEDVLRTIMTANIYYNGGTVSDTDFDELPLEVVLLDAATIDADGNMIPNASALNDDGITLLDLQGNPTFLIDLGPPPSSRGFFPSEDKDFTVLSTTGPVVVSVRAPDLADLVQADPATFTGVTMGRVIVTVSADASTLVDTPEDANPLVQFDLTTGGSAAPPPQSLFIRTVFVVSSDARGAVPTWTVVDTLPDSTFMLVSVSGRGVAELLQRNRESIFGYEYSLPVSQDSENLVANVNNDGWDFADTVVSDEWNGDNIDNVGTGEDTILFETNVATGIFGSNVMPELGSGGGGGGGGCFIATAAYGTPLAGEIQSLREVRDAYLMDTALGAAFVDAYYRISPPIARMISEYPAAKAAVRGALTPVVVMSGWMIASPGAVGVCATAVLLVMLIGAGRTRRT